MKNKCQARNVLFVSRFYSDNKLVTENVTAGSSLRFLYENHFGKSLRFFLRMPWWSKLIGIYKNSSFSTRGIKKFVQDHSINMHDFERPINQYHSFNDFFCRKLKPKARSIDQRENIIVSPADAKLLVFPKISQTMKFFVKTLPFNLETFLHSATLAEQYHEGTMMILRLAPYDYHRYHFPVEGIAHKATLIKGKYESVNPLVYASGIQPLTGNTRHIITLETKIFEQILMIPVGAMCAGKIINTYEPDKQQEKGQEAGYFAFGGSTIVLLFKKDTIDALEPFVSHSQEGFETAVKMGEAIAEKK